MTVRVLVVGTGFGARVVAPVFSDTRGCAVVQVVSARDDEGIASAIARERPDLVTVHSPPFLHDRHVRIALDAGVGAVMCDKPLTMDVGGVGFVARHGRRRGRSSPHELRIPLRSWPGAAACTRARGRSRSRRTRVVDALVERVARATPALRLAVRRVAGWWVRERVGIARRRYVALAARRRIARGDGRAHHHHPYAPRRRRTTPPVHRRRRLHRDAAEYAAT